MASGGRRVDYLGGRHPRGSLGAMATATVGPLLREWRTRRRLSQLDLALEAEVSARHLSFVETGRSRPSAEMVLHLAEQLDVPLRDRNHLLLAAGHAPVFDEHDLDEPEMAPVRDALQSILDGHDPYPAIVVDRAWEMVAGNRAVALMTAMAAPELLEPPVNALRVSLHPDGMAPRIANLAEWRAHLLERLRRQIALTGDDALQTLLEELESYPGGEEHSRDPQRIAVPLRLEGPRRRAGLHLHRGHVRHGGGGDGQRAVDRVVLPGRRGDGRGDGGLRRALTCRVIDTPPRGGHPPSIQPNGGI